MPLAEAGAINSHQSEGRIEGIDAPDPAVLVQGRCGHTRRSW